MTSMSCRSWNVISAGGSRRYLDPSDLIPDSPVVSINRAIDVIDRGITVDFACFADPPSALSKTIDDLDRYLQPPIQVWCPRPAMYAVNGVPSFHDMVSLWEPFLPASVGIRTTPFGTVSTVDGSQRRFLFCLLAALERVMMFRPERVRVLCADMMGSWAPDMTEAECEMHQSLLEQARREVSRYQKQLTASRGKNQLVAIQLQEAQRSVNELQEKGNPGIFKRWEHERAALKGLEERAKATGAIFEWRSPKQTALA